MLFDKNENYPGTNKRSYSWLLVNNISKGVETLFMHARGRPQNVHCDTEG